MASQILSTVVPALKRLLCSHGADLASSLRPSFALTAQRGFSSKASVGTSGFSGPGVIDGGAGPGPASGAPEERPPTRSWLAGPQKRQGVALKEEWVEAQHPDRDGAACWKSIVTGEYTTPGLPTPQTWHEVVDKTSGLLYYWCPATGEATTIGEPKPGHHTPREATTIGEPKPGPLGRHPSYQAEDASRRKGAGDIISGDKKDGEEVSITALYNNPLGWALLGVAAFGIVFQNYRGG
ncbi:hypothetical protein FOA52_001382 [Chlamydomonas sp. UWO 241]|nr:hypothetical protein FOA52_001382 [Chlamydomonas sp. UWO 241]